MTERTVLDVFRQEFTRDGARPFVTWYGKGGARVELSLATLELWIAKTANFLQDGVAAQPGNVAVVALPEHWLTPAIWWGCWRNGLVVVPLAPDADLPVDADIIFVTADRAGDAAGLAPDVIAVSMEPMGGPVRGDLPGAAFDFGAEAPGYDDRFTAYSPVDPAAPALRLEGRALSSAQVAAAATVLPTGARILTLLPWHSAEGLFAVVGALAAGGSIVVGTTDTRVAAAERLTGTLGITMADIPRLDEERT